MNTRIPTNDHSLHEIGALASMSPSNVVRKGKILIVDDDEEARLLHSKMLSGAGYDTEEVADGEDA